MLVVYLSVSQSVSTYFGRPYLIASENLSPTSEHVSPLLLLPLHYNPPHTTMAAQATEKLQQLDRRSLISCFHTALLTKTQ